MPQNFMKLPSGKGITICIELDQGIGYVFDKILQNGYKPEDHYIQFIPRKERNKVIQFDIESSKNQTLASLGITWEELLETKTNEPKMVESEHHRPIQPPIQVPPQPKGLYLPQNTNQQQCNIQPGYQQPSYPVNTVPQLSFSNPNNQLFQQGSDPYQQFNQNQLQQPSSQQTTGQLNDPQVQPWQQQQQQQWQQNTPPAQQQHYSYCEQQCSPAQSILQQVQLQLQELQNQINLLQTQLDHQNGELAWYKKFYEENKQLQPHQMISKLTLQQLIKQLQELEAIRQE